LDFIQIAFTLILFVILVIPVGKYLYKIINFEKHFGSRFFDVIDNFIFKITGIENENMSWKQYAVSLIVTNAVMTLLAYIIFRIQPLLGLNPNGIKAMGSTLSFNTAISFITNTNLQNYAGESGLSYLSQMIAITFLMFTSAATGLAVAMAFIRGITSSPKGLGNFYVDLIRNITRVLLPFSIVVTLLLVFQGVPQTLSPNQTATTLQGASQTIPLGPIASLESIKHLGTNGGGFFAANSAHPFENPTPISNLIEMLSMMLFSGALVYAFGLTLKNKKQGWTIFASMSMLFLMFLAICYFAEKSGNPALAHIGLSQSMGNMEGKEVRFGIAGSSLFTTVTTAFTTGSVNTVFDSLTPLGGLVPLSQMMLNVVFGGKGVGFMNMIMYAILAVFLCGLMVGRTPEFLSKKIEGKEIKLIAIAILIHPLIILVPTAIALMIPQGTGSISNPGFHGFTQILYMFTTSAANNGSSFQGLSSNTAFWNVTTGLVMFLGRYLSMMALLAVAASMAAKKPVPAGSGTFRTDNALFSFILVVIVLIVGALTFLPAVALGPVAEYLTLIR
jgi:K+-transporting ATPase ATPase A chain